MSDTKKATPPGRPAHQECPEADKVGNSVRHGTDALSFLFQLSAVTGCLKESIDKDVANRLGFDSLADTLRPHVPNIKKSQGLTH